MISGIKYGDLIRRLSLIMPFASFIQILQIAWHRLIMSWRSGSLPTRRDLFTLGLTKWCTSEITHPTGILISFLITHFILMVLFDFYIVLSISGLRVITLILRRCSETPWASSRRILWSMIHFSKHVTWRSKQALKRVSTLRNIDFHRIYVACWWVWYR